MHRLTTVVAGTVVADVRASSGAAGRGVSGPLAARVAQGSGSLSRTLKQVQVRTSAP